MLNPIIKKCPACGERQALPQQRPGCYICDGVGSIAIVPRHLKTYTDSEYRDMKLTHDTMFDRLHRPTPKQHEDSF